MVNFIFLMFMASISNKKLSISEPLLKAAAGGHWRLSRWAMRMNADIGFPVTQDGRVGVPSPGLYLVYAQVYYVFYGFKILTSTLFEQVTYVDKHKYQGFSVLVNDNVAIECQDWRCND